MVPTLVRFPHALTVLQCIHLDSVYSLKYIHKQMSSTRVKMPPPRKKKKTRRETPITWICFFFRGEGAFVHRLNEFKPIRGTNVHETSTAPSLNLHSMREGGGGGHSAF